MAVPPDCSSLRRAEVDLGEKQDQRTALNILVSRLSKARTEPLDYVHNGRVAVAFDEVATKTLKATKRQLTAANVSYTRTQGYIALLKSGHDATVKCVDLDEVRVDGTEPQPCKACKLFQLSKKRKRQAELDRAALVLGARPVAASDPEARRRI